MFTGLIEDLGSIVQISPVSGGLVLEIDSGTITEELKIGDSVAINGVCLTVTKIKNTKFSVEAVRETLERSTLGTLKTGSKINLERAVRFGARMGGHFVQGHVDGTGVIAKIEKIGSTVWFEIQLSSAFDPYIIQKGSIAIDGISLTVAEKKEAAVRISVIPHTYQHTNLHLLTEGNFVNVELDMMAKYIENMVNPKKEKKDLQMTEGWLKEHGFA